jgi:hypothetical protein
MRIHPIFFVSLLLSAQAVRESWIQPIEALITSGDLTQAHRGWQNGSVAKCSRWQNGEGKMGRGTKWVSLNCAIFFGAASSKKEPTDPRV